jgi:hypothetical protein
MIPIRVPADAPAYIASAGQQLATDHPLWPQPCPVCDTQLGLGAIALVYVGAALDDRQEGKRFITGAGLAPHHQSAARPPPRWLAIFTNGL